MSLQHEQAAGPADLSGDSRRADLLVALVGAVAGLAWAGGLRALMAEVASPSDVSWYGTFGAVLLPGAVVGALLATAWARAATGRTHRIGWFALAPLAFVVPSLGPGQLAFATLVIVGGYGLGARGAGWRRVVGTVIGLGLVVALVVAIPLVGGERLAFTQPRGAWVALLGASLTVLILLAEAIPFRASRGPVPPRAGA